MRVKTYCRIIIFLFIVEIFMHMAEIAFDVEAHYNWTSILYLTGMTIEYKKEIFGSFLELKNPNATSSCGCGESFGV